jgi:hypothetical protein
MSGHVREYLNVEQLAEVTPWSPAAIRTKVKRGELVRGVHYFQRRRGGELVFKWSAIVAFIEGDREAQSPLRPAAARGNGGKQRRTLDVEEATRRLRGLHDQLAQG